MSDDRLFVARPTDVAQLNTHWQAVLDGSPRFVRLRSPFGGGRRAVVADFIRQIDEDADAIVWRVGATDQENGVGWLLRMYASLVQAIASDPMRRGRVEMLLNGQLPTQTKRVQGWFQQFVSGLKEAKIDAATGQVQLKIPQDNPLLGLVEIAVGIARRKPIVLDLQSAWIVQSVLVAQFLEALLDEATKAGVKLMVVLHDEPDGTVRSAAHPAPLLSFIERRGEQLHTITIEPWGAEEAGKLLESKGKSADAARLAEIVDGRPGFLNELIDLLDASGQLGNAANLTLATVAPMQVDEDELDAPEAPAAEGKPKHATAEDAPRIAFVAALLGQAFPSGLVAEIAGYDRDSVDDLIDAMEPMFEQVQYAEDMRTWIYKFRAGCYREGVLLQNNTDEGHRIARNVALFLERFLAPRGVAFLTRAIRIFASHGAEGRAQALRAQAITQDDGNAWGMAYEMIRYFDEVPWTDVMRRTVFTTLLDHLAASGNAKAAEQVHGEATAWATTKEDRDLQAWLLLNGSKLDLRRQDLYRARDRARDALTLFQAIENSQRVAETHAHLAAIELQDGNPNAALDAANEALKAATVDTEDGKQAVAPQVAAQVELIRGVVNRRQNKLPDAIKHFKQSNQIAGQAGLGAVALDAGMALGEATLVSGNLEEARQVLGRVLQITQQLGDDLRQRATCELLGQAEARSKNFKAALDLAQRALQISQARKLTNVLPVDLHNVGLYYLAQNKAPEAVPFFKQAFDALNGATNHPILRDLNYHAGMAWLQTGNTQDADRALKDALPALRQTRDAARTISALQQLAVIAQRGGSKGDAQNYLKEALGLAKDANLKEDRRRIQKALEEMA